MAMPTQQKETTLKETIMALAVSPAAAEDGLLYAVTNEGVLWASANRGTTWKKTSLPGSGLAMSVAVSPTFDQDGLVWVSQPEGALIWSPDRGQTWREAYITRKASAASALAPSPSLATDNLVLAATLDDGVLRSLDRGRTWSPANFGLLDLKTLGVALCPNFASEQIALVATETALFRSRNGGLSWKEVGFWEDAVQCAAFSPNFSEDRRTWVGTEHSGLLASEDGAVTWRAVASFPKDSINVLTTVSLAQTWLLAGTGQGLHASRDLGKTWKVVLPDVNVLALGVAGHGDDTWMFAATEAEGFYTCQGKLDHWSKA
jgi:photosystem II stability/assembly factor-like uncharacterized protein